MTGLPVVLAENMVAFYRELVHLSYEGIFLYTRRFVLDENICQLSAPRWEGNSHAGSEQTIPVVSQPVVHLPHGRRIGSDASQ